MTEGVPMADQDLLISASYSPYQTIEGPNLRVRERMLPADACDMSTCDFQVCHGQVAVQAGRCRQNYDRSLVYRQQFGLGNRQMQRPECYGKAGTCWPGRQIVPVSAFAAGNG